MGARRVNFRLPEELVEEADVAASVTHRDRTEIVREALRSYLADVEDDEAFRESVVELYLDGEIGFETPSAFVGRRDAESIRASRRLLERSEGIAENLADL